MRMKSRFISPCVSQDLAEGRILIIINNLPNAFYWFAINAKVFIPF